MMNKGVAEHASFALISFGIAHLGHPKGRNSLSKACSGCDTR